MEIKLPRVYPITDPSAYKLHLACWNGRQQPLDVFLRNREEWNGWNSWRNQRDDFSRDFIFALMDFYHEPDTWLFGGAYRVLSRGSRDYAHSYKIKLVDESIPLMGRLKLSLKRPGRAKAVNFEKYYSKLIVTEILPASFTGAVFPGYDKIDVDFPVLEQIMQREHQDWKTALQHAKGVYLITDTRNGKRYVGSAYGTTGIWSRWSCYVGTGHGHNDELTRLIKKEGFGYAQKYFRFALLEYFPMKADDQFVITRETYWKEVLHTRGPRGYNKN